MITNRRLLLLQLLALTSLWFCNAGKCNRKDGFEAAVLVIHEGMEFDYTNADEFETLGELFVKAWDEMNHEGDHIWCDAHHFRNIRKVTIEPEDKGVAHKSTDERLARKSFLYTIEGGCQNSCPDYQLFAPIQDYDYNNGGGEQDDEDENRCNLLARGAFTNNDFTDCKCKDKKVNRGPTEDEFLPTFQELVQKAKLDHIKTVYDVIEYNRFACSEEQIHTEEDVHIQMSEGIKKRGDKKPFEAGYMDAYNTLVKYFCHDDADSYVFDANLISSRHSLRARRRLVVYKNRLLLLRTRKMRRARRKAAVFQDMADRRLDDSPTSHDKVPADMESYTYTHTCHCPLRPRAFRAPNETEITEAYQQMLKYQEENGELHGKYIIGSLKTSLKTSGKLECGSPREEGHLGSEKDLAGEIVVPEGASCNIYGDPQYTISGGITVEEGGTLRISGEVIVTKRVEVKKGAALYVSTGSEAGISKCPVFMDDIIASDAKAVVISSTGGDCDIEVKKKIEIKKTTGPTVAIAGVTVEGEIKIEESHVDELRVANNVVADHQIVIKKNIVNSGTLIVSNQKAKRILISGNTFVTAGISGNTKVNDSIEVSDNEYEKVIIVRDNEADVIEIEENVGTEDDSYLSCTGNDADEFKAKKNEPQGSSQCD